jgi:hypothetical protein
MNYTVEMRLVKIKSVKEIQEEIAEGIYKGDSHVYETVFKRGDETLGEVENFGSSNIDKANVERFFKELLSARDSVEEDSVSLSGKVRLTDISDPSFPIVSRTFDYFTPVAAAKVSAREPKVVAKAFSSADELVESVANRVDKIATKTDFSTVKRLDVDRVITTAQFDTDWKATAPAVDVAKLVQDADSDKSLATKGTFNQIAAKSDLKLDGVVDHFSAFNFDPKAHVLAKPANYDSLNLVERQKYVEPTKTELVFKAMKGMLDKHTAEREGVAGPELDALLKKQTVEKTLFAFRNKQANVASKSSAAHVDLEQVATQETRLRELYHDFQKSSHPEPVITTAPVRHEAPTRAAKLLASDRKADYSHNPKLVDIMEKSHLRTRAKLDVERFKPNAIFGQDAMLQLMNMNDSLRPSVRVREKAFDLLEDASLAFSNNTRRIHENLMDKYAERGMSVTELSLPRDFFNNTKYFETITTFHNPAMRKHTTGEYIAHYNELAQGSKDLMVEDRIARGIDHVYSTMLSTHREEERITPQDKLDTLKAQHAFERAYCEFQETYHNKTSLNDAERDVLKQTMENLTGLYNNFMELNTGLPCKAPFTAEQRYEELKTASEASKKADSRMFDKSKAQSMVQQMRSPERSPLVLKMKQ